MASAVAPPPPYLDEVARFKAQFPEVTHLEPAELKQMLRDGPITLVDVRAPEECDVSMIPGAVRPDALPDPPPPRPIVFYCTAGYRSSLAAIQLAAKAPAAQIFSMVGILPWVHEGGEIVDADGRPTRRLHLFSQKWAAWAPAHIQADHFATRSFGFVRAILQVIKAWIAVLCSWAHRSTIFSSPARGSTYQGRDLCS
jgi:rhodanese-related sulfurtransferase